MRMMQEFEANATRKWCDVDHFTERRTGERHVERLDLGVELSAQGPQIQAPFPGLPQRPQLLTSCQTLRTGLLSI